MVQNHACILGVQIQNHAGNADDDGERIGKGRIAVHGVCVQEVQGLAQTALAAHRYHYNALKRLQPLNPEPVNRIPGTCDRMVVARRSGRVPHDPYRHPRLEGNVFSVRSDDTDFVVPAAIALAGGDDALGGRCRCWLVVSHAAPFSMISPRVASLPAMRTSSRVNSAAAHNAKGPPRRERPF